MNPDKAGAPGTYSLGTYEFAYKASPTECQGGARTVEGLQLGGGKEHVSQEVKGLSAETEYSVCLVARNSRGEETLGPAITFLTGPAPSEMPETQQADEITSTTAKLKGVLNPKHPGQAGGYWFTYMVSATNCVGPDDGLGPREGRTEEAAATGHQSEAVEATVLRLTPDTTYTACLVARNSAYEQAVGTPVTFTTKTAAPTIAEESVSHLGSGEATIGAEIGAGGLATSYRVEYGESEAYGSRTAEVRLPAAGAATGVLVHLEGLRQGTRYHYRLAATNELGTALGSDASFVTFVSTTTTALSLPDNRAYELVSPPEETQVYVPEVGESLRTGEGEFVASFEAYKLRAAENGGAVTFIGDPPASGVGGNGEQGEGGDGNVYLATRGASGWQSKDIELPEKGAEGVGDSIKDLSADLSVITLQNNYPIQAEPEPPTGCDIPPEYRYTAYSLIGGRYQSLVPTDGTPGHCYAEVDDGISADDSHILLSAPYAFTASAIESHEFSKQNLYDSVGGTLHQDNVLPDGEPQQHPDGRFGGPGVLVGDVSGDGSRIFWTDMNTEVTPEDPAGTTRLFVRENDTQPQSPIGPKGECTAPQDACTVQVDASQGGPGAGGDGQFKGASSDGSKVFFTDENRLTADATAAPNEPDLYEYEVNGEAGRPGVLTDLTVAKSGDADVREFLGASEDGSYVYFVADGMLTNEPNAEGKTPVAGKPNLYVSHNGATTFIVTEPGIMTAEVAPGGHAVAFRSLQSLTGYDNDGYRGEELPEIFVYEADEAHIFCASCSSTGAPPVPSSEAWEDTDNAVVPIGQNPAFGLRWINTTGTQVFFMTNQPLVSGDTNSRDDVYEWESDGTSACQQAAGCIAPLSDVSSPTAAFLLDTSASGDDVFFTERASLTQTAVGEAVKLYDARVDGNREQAALSCTGTGCQGVPPAAPIFATPSSVTFNGVGNFEPAAAGKTVTPKQRKTGVQARAEKLRKALKRCKRDPRKRRAACERVARKTYGPAKRKGKR
ncbi:MAG TPA: fibronectin type III domain-containing protein [Solirubrobacteraceae bacterium]|nr:fibronectin type III domain-containing protein [Solirubrobacteraceae bacterium]